jgi:ribose-phosphate pyrophosphokinase
LDASLAIIDKRRTRANEVAEMHIVGDVRERTAVLVDDMIDTAGTLVAAATAVMENGARAVLACCTHPVLSGSAITRIEQSVLQELIVTDTIPLRPDAQACSKITVLPVAHLLGEAIKRTHYEESISSLFV